MLGRVSFVGKDVKCCIQRTGRMVYILVYSIIFIFMALAVAVMTVRIRHLTEHVKKNRKDYSCLRRLVQLVQRRRTMLMYLRRTNLSSYLQTVSDLGLKHPVTERYPKKTLSQQNRAAVKRKTKKKKNSKKLKARKKEASKKLAARNKAAKKLKKRKNEALKQLNARRKEA